MTVTKRPEGTNQYLIFLGGTSKRIRLGEGDPGTTTVHIDIKSGVLDSTSKNVGNSQKYKTYFRKGKLKRKSTPLPKQDKNGKDIQLCTKYRKSGVVRARYRFLIMYGLKVQHGHKILYDEYGNVLYRLYYSYGRPLDHYFNTRVSSVPENFKLDNIVFRDRETLNRKVNSVGSVEEFRQTLVKDPLEIYEPQYKKIFEIFRKEDANV